MALNPVHAVLIAHGTKSLWHYTLVENLPGILREGAIYSRAELGRRGIACSSEHYYGDPEKERILAEYVSCATMPPWGMMGNETDQLAILDINPAVVATQGTCFCPGWSPKAHFDAAEIVTWTTPADAEDLYSGEGYQTVLGAEIFVPDVIGLRDIRGIVFYDRGSVDEALPDLRRALDEGDDDDDTSDHTISLTVNPTKFPRDWRVVGPPWMRDELDDDDPVF